MAPTNPQKCKKGALPTTSFADFKILLYENNNPQQDGSHSTQNIVRENYASTNTYYSGDLIEGKLQAKAHYIKKCDYIRVTILAKLLIHNNIELSEAFRLKATSNGHFPYQIMEEHELYRHSKIVATNYLLTPSSSSDQTSSTSPYNAPNNVDINEDGLHQFGFSIEIPQYTPPTVEQLNLNPNLYFTSFKGSIQWTLRAKVYPGLTDDELDEPMTTPMLAAKRRRMLLPVVVASIPFRKGVYYMNTAELRPTIKLSLHPISTKFDNMHHSAKEIQQYRDAFVNLLQTIRKDALASPAEIAPRAPQITQSSLSDLSVSTPSRNTPSRRHSAIVAELSDTPSMLSELTNCSESSMTAAASRLPFTKNKQKLFGRSMPAQRSGSLRNPRTSQSPITESTSSASSISPMDTTTTGPGLLRDLNAAPNIYIQASLSKLIYYRGEVIRVNLSIFNNMPGHVVKFVKIKAFQTALAARIVGKNPSSVQPDNSTPASNNNNNNNLQRPALDILMDDPQALDAVNNVSQFLSHQVDTALSFNGINPSISQQGRYPVGSDQLHHLEHAEGLDAFLANLQAQRQSSLGPSHNIVLIPHTTESWESRTLIDSSMVTRGFPLVAGQLIRQDVSIMPRFVSQKSYSPATVPSFLAEATEILRPAQQQPSPQNMSNDLQAHTSRQHPDPPRAWSQSTSDVPSSQLQIAQPIISNTLTGTAASGSSPHQDQFLQTNETQPAHIQSNSRPPASGSGNTITAISAMHPVTDPESALYQVHSASHTASTSGPTISSKTPSYITGSTPSQLVPNGNSQSIISATDSSVNHNHVHSTSNNGSNDESCNPNFTTAQPPIMLGHRRRASSLHNTSVLNYQSLLDSTAAAAIALQQPHQQQKGTCMCNACSCGEACRCLHGPARPGPASIGGPSSASTSRNRNSEISNGALIGAGGQVKKTGGKASKKEKILTLAPSMYMESPLMRAIVEYSIEIKVYIKTSGGSIKKCKGEFKFALSDDPYYQQRADEFGEHTRNLEAAKHREHTLRAREPVAGGVVNLLLGQNGHLLYQDEIGQVSYDYNNEDRAVVPVERSVLPPYHLIDTQSTNSFSDL